MIFSKYKLGEIELKNRIVMAPMTRSRAIDNMPNDLMAIYYGQRDDAGLIITEGVSPSPNGLGYPRIPGAYSKKQTEAWKKVTEAVNEKEGKIFMQLMHTGRVTHPGNLPQGGQHLAPSSVGMSGQMYVDGKGMLDYPLAQAMTQKQIHEAIEEYVQASKNAIYAGMHGVELHGANGYLIDQFINAASNKRDDEYGGPIENRVRFAIEVAKKVSDAIGADKTGIRLSPYGVFNDMEIFEGIDECFVYLAEELGKLGLAYLHIVDHSSMGAPEVPNSLKQKMKKAFGGTMVISGGLDKSKAEAALENDLGELVAFGKPFISNPDLVNRMKNNIELAEYDQSTFYTPGPKGYTDYPNSEN